MSKLFLFEIAIFILASIVSLSGVIEIHRAGQVLLALGIIDLIVAVLAWMGVPVIRGDISLLEPIANRELEVISPEQATSDLIRPSAGLLVQTAGIGIVAILGGVLWILFVT